MAESAEHPKSTYLQTEIDDLTLLTVLQLGHLFPKTSSKSTRWLIVPVSMHILYILPILDSSNIHPKSTDILRFSPSKHFDQAASCKQVLLRKQQ